jgi:hypothetical protein
MKVMMTPPLNAQRQIATNTTPSAQRRSRAVYSLLAPLALLMAGTAFAQNAAPAPLVAAASPAAFAGIAAATPLQLPIVSPDEFESSSSIADSPIADSPTAHRNNLPEDPSTGGVAPIYSKYIPAGMTAQPIDAHDKVVIGLRDVYSPLNFAAIIFTAGYEQVINREPNYGTDRGAFGERLGAAGIRESTQSLFTDTIFAPLLHEDPRYYVEGPQHGFFHRTLYAATRPLITRTDSGHSSVNGALLLGYAASSALTYTYYPQINRDFHDTASTFGGAIGGAAIGFLVSEFSADVLQMLHLAKKR